MASTEQDVHDSDSDLDTSTSTQSASTRTTARKKQVRHRFSSWTFQRTLSTDSTALNGGPASVPLQERQKYLLEHIRSRIINTDKMPRIVTFVEVYYNASIISGALADGISISIPLLGFVQTRACTNCEISTMQFWFPASWAPVPGGLSARGACCWRRPTAACRQRASAGGSTEPSPRTARGARLAAACGAPAARLHLSRGSYDASDAGECSGRRIPPIAARPLRCRKPGGAGEEQARLAAASAGQAPAGAGKEPARLAARRLAGTGSAPSARGAGPAGGG